jgi:hypothetical protein
LLLLLGRLLLSPFVGGDALLEELFVGVGESVALGDVGAHGFEAAHVFVFVEAGEGFVLLDVEDQHQDLLVDPVWADARSMARDLLPTIERKVKGRP